MANGLPGFEKSTRHTASRNCLKAQVDFQFQDIGLIALQQKMVLDGKCQIMIPCCGRERPSWKDRVYVLHPGESV